MTPQTILPRPLIWPETFFYIMWSTFWKYRQMYPSECQSSFIFVNFYFHLPTGEYERDFSLFNFFFGILKCFCIVLLILKYFFENYFYLFTKWFFLTAYTKHLFKKYAVLWFPECGNTDNSRKKIILNVIMVK